MEIDRSNKFPTRHLESEPQTQTWAAVAPFDGALTVALCKIRQLRADEDMAVQTAGVGGDDDAGFVYGLGLESQLMYGTTGRIEYLEYDGE